MVTKQTIPLNINKVYGSKSGNDCCHSVQKLLTSSFLSQIIKIKIHRTIILLVVVVVVIIVAAAVVVVAVCARAKLGLSH